MTEYKAVLNKWHKGTCGGPGLSIYLESWSTEKLDRYNIDLNQYDHTIVINRPAILFDKYHNDNRKLYLTIIHLWDNISHNLLSSRYDPFQIKGGEIGVDDSSGNNSSISSVSKDVSSSTSSLKKRIKDDSTATTPSRHAKKKKLKRASPQFSKKNGSTDLEEINTAIKDVMKVYKVNTDEEIPKVQQKKLKIYH